jgi:hypothetical protein
MADGEFINERRVLGTYRNRQIKEMELEPFRSTITLTYFSIRPVRVENCNGRVIRFTLLKDRRAEHCRAKGPCSIVWAERS